MGGDNENENENFSRSKKTENIIEATCISAQIIRADYHNYIVCNHEKFQDEVMT